MTCGKCGSENVIVQREQSWNVGGSIHSIGGGKTGHGIMYWLFVGWWIWILKMLVWMFKWGLAMCTLGISLLFTRKKKDKIGGKTVTANKTINKTVAVCQDCGYHWNV